MAFWYQSPYNNRHPKLKEDTVARSKKGAVNLKAYTHVQPVREDFLPRDSWIFEEEVWCKETHVACHTDQHGFVLIRLEHIDFSR